MIARIKLKNFNSLVDFEINFKDRRNRVKKFIAIYGENGSGKTNLLSSLKFLNTSAETIFSTVSFDKFTNSLNELNKTNTPANDLFQALYNKLTLKSLIENNKTIDTTENMICEYEFSIDKITYLYTLEFNEGSIINEKLVCNDKVLYDLSNDRREIDKELILDSNYKDNINEQISKYFGKNTFLSIINFEIDDKNTNFIEKNLSKKLYKFINYINDLEYYFFDNSKNNKKVKSNLLDVLDIGSINKQLKDKLMFTQTVLNNFFTSLYADVTEVFYETSEVGNKIEYRLKMSKNVDGKIRIIDFANESAGTKNLLITLKYYISAAKGGIVFCDEIDNGIHDLLIEQIMKTFSNSIKGQFIFSTHNTLLLENNDIAKNAYILTINNNGKKEAKALRDFENRVHKNINFRIRYLNGLYGGVPYTLDIDFDELG